ncbi:hypothetical protein EV182_003493, partial [Spiromyces aspiralis]
KSMRATRNHQKLNHPACWNTFTTTHMKLPIGMTPRRVNTSKTFLRTIARLSVSITLASNPTSSRPITLPSAPTAFISNLDAHEPVESPIQESHYLMTVTDDDDTHKSHEYTLYRKDEVVNIPKEPDDRPTQHDTAHEHTPRPTTHFWPDATTESTSYVQQRQPLNPLNGSTPYDQRFGQAPNSAHHRTTSCATYQQATPYDQRFGQAPNSAHHRTTSCATYQQATPYDQRLGQAPNISHLSRATYHQVTPYSQWFGKTPNIPHPHTIGYAAYQRTTPYSLWFGHTPSIARTRTFDRVDHCQATPNETDEKTRPPDRREFPTDYNPIPSAYISWSEVSAKDTTMHDAISDENRTHCEPDNTNTATERQELIISDTTAKCPASRTASDDYPSGTHTSNAHPNDTHPNCDHPSDEHSNYNRPSDEHSSDDPTYEQIKSQTDVQQWHDATSTESCDIPKKKHISTRNVGFDENKTCRDYKHADTNTEKPELITIGETAKHTTSRTPDNAHPTSDSTYEDAIEVPPHIATRNAILDENNTHREPGNTNTAIERQEFVISYTIAKCPASHTTSDDCLNDAHTSDAHTSYEHSSDEHSSDDRLNGERSSNVHPSNVHPSDAHSTDDPAHEQTKSRVDKRQPHDAANAETRDVPKKGNIVADTVSRANAQAHIPGYKNFKADNELWDDQAALASAEDEHLDDSTSDQATTADANRDDNYSKPTRYPQNRRHRPEISPEQRWRTHDTPLKPSDAVSPRDNYTLTRRRSMLIPKQTEPHKIAEQVTDDIYCFAELNRATSMGQ